MATRIAEYPPGCVYLWLDGRIAGQIEMRPRGTPPVGYVNLFYLIPELRGSGLGADLHEYAVSTFAALDIRKFQLMVNPDNPGAIAFYAKYGWRDTGLRGADKTVRLMEFSR